LGYARLPFRTELCAYAAKHKRLMLTVKMVRVRRGYMWEQRKTVPY